MKRLWAKCAKTRTTRVAAGSVVAPAAPTERSAKPMTEPQRVLTEESFKIPRANETTAKTPTGAAANHAIGAKAASGTHTQTTNNLQTKTNLGINSAAAIAMRRQSTEANRPNLTFKRPSDAFRMLRGPVRPSRSDLINAESALGSQIFGPVPEGHRREFFHDKENIWIWHEEWVDAEWHERQLTVRYEVRTTGVFKKVAAGKYYRLEGEELANFRKATHAYLKIIKEKLYTLPEVKIA